MLNILLQQFETNFTNTLKQRLSLASKCSDDTSISRNLNFVVIGPKVLPLV